MIFVPAGLAADYGFDEFDGFECMPECYSGRRDQAFDWKSLKGAPG